MAEEAEQYQENQKQGMKSGGVNQQYKTLQRGESPKLHPVLVVEDHDTLRLALVLQLKSLGIQADSAANGIEALERVRQVNYTLVLMDVMMPEMDGLEATIAVRDLERAESPRTPVKIVAITGGGASKQQCFEAGMNAYYEKPICVEAMKQILQEMAPSLLEINR